MVNGQGYIKLYRTFLKNPLWKEPRQLSRAEAWLDLLFSARFEASKELLNNRVIEVQRGELIASRRYLEERWKWGSSKVTNFLDFLKNEGMINQRQTAGQTIIIICKYDYYNGTQTNGLSENEPTTNQRQTSDKPATNQNKESKEYKERKEDTPISPIGDISPKKLKSIEDRKKEFHDSLVSFSGDYQKDMIQAFFDYWTEANPAKTKMRFELEKTWETKKRLSVWKSREKPNIANNQVLHQKNKRYDNF